jgi:hypothetical protein
MQKQPLPLTRRKDLTVFVPVGEPELDHRKLTEAQTIGPVLTVVPYGHPVPAAAKPGAWTLTLPRHGAFLETVLGHAAKLVSPDPAMHALAEKCRAALAEKAVSDENENFAFCCVADQQYLPFFFGLVENLRAVHRGPLEIHLLALENGVRELVKTQYPTLPLSIYQLEDIWSAEELAHLKKRSIGSQAYTSKPRVLLHARRKSSASAVFLLDLDMYFFRDPAHLNLAFGDSHTLLFPQWSDRFTWARLHGCVNSGMVGARKGAESLVSWWSRACLIRCDMNVEQGFFGDQGFLDQALVLFRGVQIYRDWDEDVAPWNRETLDAAWGELGLVVGGDKPVGSFHAAGPDADGIFETKYAWDQIITLFSVLADPDECRPLFLNTLEQQRRHWPGLDRALRLRQLVGARLKMRTNHVTPEWTRDVTRGVGAAILSALDAAHARYAKWRGHAPAFDVDNDRWVALQRLTLFNPDQLLIE